MRFGKEKFDPSKASILDESLSLKQDKDNRPTVFRDVNTGEKFHNISRESVFFQPKILVDPEKQKFISLLFKGIINTADIVKDPKTGEYFSHEQNLDSLSPEKKNFREEV